MIYVLGSINMDLVLNVPYVPKNGETLTSTAYNTYCGGKGANQAVAVAKLGAKVKMAGGIGSDGFGQTLKNNLIVSGVDTSLVEINGEDSGIAVILIEDGNNRIILSPGANGRMSENDVDKALTAAGKNDILLVQLEIPENITAYALKTAKEKGMTTVLNPAPASPDFDTSIYKYIDIIAPNETETEILTGVNPTGIVEIALAVKKFYSYGVKSVILTLGERGAAVAEGMNITEIEPHKVKVVDTTAAGDTFIGAVCACLQKGMTLTESAIFANCASSITIQRKGASVSIPSYEEVEKVYKLCQGTVL